jgi:hypothetical protein
VEEERGTARPVVLEQRPIAFGRQKARILRSSSAKETSLTCSRPIPRSSVSTASSRHRIHRTNGGLWRSSDRYSAMPCNV